MILRNASEARHLLRGVLDALPSHVAVLDETGRIVDVNDAWTRFARLNGGTLADCGVGASYLDVCERGADSPSDGLAAARGIRRVIRGQSASFVMDYECGRPGEFRWFRVRAARVPSQDELRVLVTHDDITVQRQSEEALRERSAQKDEFVAAVAHELRNPLSPISSALEILRMRPEDRESVDAARSVMQRQLTQLTRLVDDLLDMSRLSLGKVDLQCEPTDLASIVEQAVETARPLLDGRSQQLRVSVAPGPLTIEADRARLVQVVLNLLTNAAKYSDAGASVRLVVERASGRAVVRVLDNGIGIPPEVLPHMFDPFVQGAPGREQVVGGLGIGLFLVQQLTELHGGTVSAHSEGLGRGSEFVVRLPLLPSAEAVAAPSMAGEGAARTTPRRVLVVDDHEDSADLLVKLLEGAGHVATARYDGESALACASDFGAEVVVLDIGLPGMDGYEVAQRLRVLQPDTVMVALTGWGQPQDLQRSRQAGIRHHLVKPLEFATLEEVLARVAP